MKASDEKTPIPDSEFRIWGALIRPFRGQLVVRFLSSFVLPFIVLLALAANGYSFLPFSLGWIQSGVDVLELVALEDPWVLVLLMFAIVYASDLARIPFTTRLRRQIVETLSRSDSRALIDVPAGSVNLMIATRLVEATFGGVRSPAPLFATIFSAAITGLLAPALALFLAVLVTLLGFRHYVRRVISAFVGNGPLPGAGGVRGFDRAYLKAMRIIDRPATVLSSSWPYHFVYLIVSLGALFAWVWTAFSAPALSGGQTLFLVAGLGFSLRSITQMRSSVEKLGRLLATLGNKENAESESDQV